MPAKKRLCAPEKLARLQTRFAAHIRDPETVPPPANIEQRRMRIYTELFFNSLSSLLSGTFPVIHELLTPAQWNTLVRAFYRSGSAHTPYFPEIPRDFVHWLTRENPLPDKPFLPELAHYEWLELAVQIDNRPAPESQPLPEKKEALLNGCPVPNPWVRLGSYTFPVHRIKPDFQPCKESETGHFFLIYRDTDNSDDTVRFLNINAISAWLFAAFQDNPDMTLKHILKSIAEKIGQGHPEALEDAAVALIQDWHQRGIIAGYRQKTDC